MYDDAIRAAVLDRVVAVIDDLARHPGQAALVAGGVAIFLLWLCRKK